MKIKKIILLILTGFFLQTKSNNPDVLVVGLMKFYDGLGRLSILFLNMLKDKYKLSFLPSRPNYYIDFADIDSTIKEIVSSSKSTNASIILFTDFIHVYEKSVLPKISKKTSILFAYSMLESTLIPSSWVHILNEKFDAVIVPDSFIKRVYESSGVKIPIFVLPHPIIIEELLNISKKEKKSSIFTFGMSAGFFSRKNHQVLLEAFSEEFGNNPDVFLKIHGREIAAEQIVLLEIKNVIKKNKLKNVDLIVKNFSQKQYINFLNSLDCYIFPSKGEGFSVTPREALALGLPCIISKNTAHLTLCQTGFVEPISSDNLEHAWYSIFNKNLGYQFACDKKNLRQIMKDIFFNYEFYLKKAKGRKIWVKQYLEKNLKKSYETLFYPSYIIQSKKNKIKNGILYTNSPNLFEKYTRILNVKVLEPKIYY